MSNFTLCVSFPRSGHHLLERLLKMNTDELRYCEVYNHCQRIPCINPETNFQKTHDFELSDPIVDGAKHIIQFRNPYDSISSWYNLNVRSGAITEDSKENWVDFYKQKLLFWEGFAKKWLLPSPSPNSATLRRLAVRYEELISNTETELVRILKFLDLEAKAEHIEIAEKENKINEHGRIINTVPKPQRDIKEFRYFDEGDKQACDKMYRDFCKASDSIEA